MATNVETEDYAEALIIARTLLRNESFAIYLQTGRYDEAIADLLLAQEAIGYCMIAIREHQLRKKYGELNRDRIRNTPSTDTKEP